MKSKYPSLTRLLALIALVALLFTFHIITGTAAVALLCLGQLAALAVSRPRAGVFYFTALSEEQMREFESICKSLTAEYPRLKGLPEKFTELQKSNDELRGEMRKIKKSSLAGVGQPGIRWVNDVPFVSEDAAKAIVTDFLLQVEGLPNALPRLFPDEGKRAYMLGKAREFAGITVRAGGALGTADIPLPTIYMPQVVELVFAYGQARKFGTVFPLGAGTVKLPRLQVGEDAFAVLGAGTAGNSQNIPQKEVSAQLVTFTANKCGGLIRIPSEVEEDTFIALGQFLARYIARQFAKMEDMFMFMADGTGTYAGMVGVGQYCVNNPTYLHALGAGKTVLTDATVNDFRAMRGLVNAAVLSGMAQIGTPSASYYLHPTLESLLVTFNTIGSPQIYIPARAGQPATLDGFPIRWIGVSAANTGNAQPNAFIAFFGDLSYWYLGERGTPRVEVSREVFFATDELAMRALERVDVEAMAIDAMSAMQLPAS